MHRAAVLSRAKLLLLLGAVPACAQSVPSDAAKLSIRELARLMQIACPGPVKDAQTCAACPSDSGFPDDRRGWRLAAVTMGHFTAPKENEVLLSTVGCEPHAAGSGGAFLLRDEGNGYQQVWYRPCYIATDWKKLKATDGRDMLICESSDGHQGIEDQFLYLLDLNGPDASTLRAAQIFFSVPDSLDSCAVMTDGYASTGYIERVSFSTKSQPARVEIGVNVRAGKAVLPQKVLEEDCNLNSKPDSEDFKPVIATKALVFRFVFDGSSVHPAANNPDMNGIEPVAPVTSYFVPEPGHPIKARR